MKNNDSYIDLGQIMKVVLCVSIIFNFQFSIFNSAHAQKYACVNTDYVLRSVPEYANAQKRSTNKPKWTPCALISSRKAIFFPTT